MNSQLVSTRRFRGWVKGAWQRKKKPRLSDKEMERLSLAKTAHRPTVNEDEEKEDNF